MISGLCAGIAGLVVVAINSSSDAKLVGLGMELDADELYELERNYTPCDVINDYTAGRPVATRAILTAFSTASAPVFSRIDF